MAALCVLLAAACGYDYRYHKIPNVLIILIAIAGVMWRFRQGGIMDAAAYAGEACLVMCLFYPLFKIGAVGAGDVKLLGVAAGYLPFMKILVFLCLSLLAAAVISVIKMFRCRFFLERLRYFWDYFKSVLKSGAWRLYLEDEREKKAVGICLSGPILLSILLYMGGIY